MQTAGSENSFNVALNPPPSHSGCRFAQMRERAAGSPPPSAPSALVGDILYGADAIAEFMYGSKDSRRTVYNLIQKQEHSAFSDRGDRVRAEVCAARLDHRTRVALISVVK